MSGKTSKKGPSVASGEGDGESDAGSEGGVKKTSTLSRGASNLAQKVGSLFGARGRKSTSSTAEESTKSRRKSPAEKGTRVEIGYYGKRTDARDRSSEDPRRHAIPRATVTPTKSRSPTPMDQDESEPRPRVKLRKRSMERERERRVSRERELERERRPRDRSRSRERPTSQIMASSSSSMIASSAGLVRSSSSVTASKGGQGESPTRRQASFKVERRIELSRQEVTSVSTSPRGPPPAPPPRARPRTSETSFDSVDAAMAPKPTATSTPKKTPYQFWREQRLKQDELAKQRFLDRSRESLESNQGITSTEPMGAVPKRSLPFKEQPADREENADEILARWKRERAKRERNASGTSAASSTTAEPTLKRVSVRQHTVATMTHTPPPDEEDQRRKSSVLTKLQALARRRSAKESAASEAAAAKKYSIESLMRSAPLNPSVHDVILQPGAATNQASAVLPKSEQAALDDHVPVHGTILKPVLPKQGNTRPPLEEWRRYRSSRESLMAETSSRPRTPSMATPGRGQTPDPDYDTVSVGSASSKSSAGDGGRHYTRYPRPAPTLRSASAMGIPRYVARHHLGRGGRPTSSLMSASPRLEGAQSPAEGFFGRHGARLATTESQMWYQEYSHEAFTHEAEFKQEEATLGVYNYDVRIHSIKGDGREIFHGRLP